MVGSLLTNKAEAERCHRQPKARRWILGATTPMGWVGFEGKKCNLGADEVESSASAVVNERLQPK